MISFYIFVVESCVVLATANTAVKLSSCNIEIDRQVLVNDSELALEPVTPVDLLIVSFH